MSAHNERRSPNRSASAGCHFGKSTPPQYGLYSVVPARRVSACNDSSERSDNYWPMLVTHGNNSAEVVSRQRAYMSGRRPIRTSWVIREWLLSYPAQGFFLSASNVVRSSSVAFTSSTGKTRFSISSDFAIYTPITRPLESITSEPQCSGRLLSNRAIAALGNPESRWLDPRPK
jgi:hypothetical protein